MVVLLKSGVVNLMKIPTDSFVSIFPKVRSF